MASELMSSAPYTPSLPDLDSASSFSSSAYSSFSVDSFSESSSSPRSFDFYTGSDHHYGQSPVIGKFDEESQRDYPPYITKSSTRPNKLRKQPPGLPDISGSFYTHYLPDVNEQRGPAPMSSSPKSASYSNTSSPVHTSSHIRTCSASLRSALPSSIFMNDNDDSHIAYAPSSSSDVKSRVMGVKRSASAHMEPTHALYPLLGLNGANPPLPPLEEKDFGTRLPWDASPDSEQTVYPIHVQDVYLKSGRDHRVCREIIQTECHYLSSLQTLLSGQKQTKPPRLMMQYLPALIQASERLLSEMEANPTPNGISAAFVSLESQTAKALAGWSGVAESFFKDSPPSRRESESSISSSDNEVPLYLRRKVGLWRKGIPMLDAVSFYLPAVRDLALLPTERVARYVELFEELLSYTSQTGTTKNIVQEAMEAAIDIRHQCARAQENAAPFV